MAKHIFTLLVLSIILLSITHILLAQNVSVSFMRTWGVRDSDDAALDLIVYNDLLLADIGLSNGSALVCFDQRGVLQWSRVFSGVDRIYMSKLGFVRNDLVVVGYSVVEGISGLSIVVFEPLKDSISSQYTYLLPRGYSIQYVDTYISNDNIYIVALTEYQEENYAVVVGIDSRYRVLWSNSFKLDKFTTITSIAVDRDYVYVLGDRIDTGSAIVYTLSTSDGSVLEAYRIDTLEGSIAITDSYTVNNTLYSVGMLGTSKGVYGLLLVYDREYTALVSNIESMFNRIVYSNNSFYIAGSLYSKEGSSALAIILSPTYYVIDSIILEGVYSTQSYLALPIDSNITIIGSTNTGKVVFKRTELEFTSIDTSYTPIEPPILEPINLEPYSGEPIVLEDIEGELDSIVEGGDMDAFIAMLTYEKPPSEKVIRVCNYDGSPITLIDKIMWVEIYNPVTQELLLNSTVTSNGELPVHGLSDGEYRVSVWEYDLESREKFYWGSRDLKIVGSGVFLFNRTTPFITHVVLNPTTILQGTIFNISITIYQPSRLATMYEGYVEIELTDHGALYTKSVDVLTKPSEYSSINVNFSIFDPGSYSYRLRLYVSDDYYTNVLTDYYIGEIEVIPWSEAVSINIDAPEEIYAGEIGSITVTITNLLDAELSTPVVISTTPGMMVLDETKYLVKIAPHSTWSKSVEFRCSKENTTQTIYVNITDPSYSEVFFTVQKNITILPLPPTTNTTTPIQTVSTSRTNTTIGNATINQTIAPTEGGGDMTTLYIVIGVVVAIVAIIVFIFWRKRRASYW